MIFPTSLRYSTSPPNHRSLHPLLLRQADKPREFTATEIGTSQLIRSWAVLIHFTFSQHIWCIVSFLLSFLPNFHYQS